VGLCVIVTWISLLFVCSGVISSDFGCNICGFCECLWILWYLCNFVCFPVLWWILRYLGMIVVFRIYVMFGFV